MHRHDLSDTSVLTIQQSVMAFRVTVILLHTPNPHESLGGWLFFFFITTHPKLAERAWK